jgi:hypothetical protein
MYSTVLLTTNIAAKILKMDMTSVQQFDTWEYRFLATDWYKN